MEEKLLKRLLIWGEAKGLPVPKRDYKPFTTNSLEMDFAWPDHKVSIEVQGGIRQRGRRGGHTSINGMYRDIYKDNLAQTQGWILLHFPPEYCTCDQHWELAKRFLNKAFKQRGI